MARKRRENQTEPPVETETVGACCSTPRKCTKRVKELPKSGFSAGFSGGGNVNHQPTNSAEALTPQHRGTLKQIKCSVSMLHSSAKMKMQLFPVNEHTRQGLEKDGFHPYLELTLSSQKKILSVLKHLNSKWSSSSIVLGEPTLYPYEKTEHFAGSKWTTNHSNITVGDVYESIGSPALFRLRYGWLPKTESATLGMPSTSTPSNSCFQLENIHKSSITKMESTCGTKEHIANASNTIANESEAINPVFLTISSGETDQSKDDGMNKNSYGQRSVLWDDGLISMGGLFSEASLQDKLKNSAQNTNGKKTGLLDDRFSISLGNLASEASLKGRFNDHNKTLNTNGMYMQTSPPISESLDAFLNGQTNETHDPTPVPSMPLSSILDAEDTCHAFSFKKVSPSWMSPAPNGGNGNSAGSQMTQHWTDSFKTPKKNQEHVCREPETPEFSSQILNQDSSLGLSGIKWTESLGPFDLGWSSSRKLISSSDSISLSGIVKDLKEGGA